MPFEWAQVTVKSLSLSNHVDVFLRNPWSIFTYIFLHNGIFHLLSNMLFLYFIGEIFRSLAGNKHIGRNFIWGGVSGGLLYLFYYNVIPDFTGQSIPAFMVGASGGVTAVVVAAAVFTPDYEIRLFGVFSIKLKWIAVARVLLDLLGLGDGVNDGGQVAHLGGALFGYLYVKWMRGDLPLPNLNIKRRKLKRTSPPRRKFKVHINQNKSEEPVREQTSPSKSAFSQKEIDDILDKISNSGYDSLTTKEKETLFRASKDL